MNLMQYRLRRDHPPVVRNPQREFCANCWQPSFNCFCHTVDRFDPHIEFVILIHPIESRKRIATGRMSYLSLENSHIVRGVDFSQCPTVNRLLSDTDYFNVLLAKSPQSRNLSTMSNSEISELVPPLKKLRVFVLDGKWCNAHKMYVQSPNLHLLPQICFTPTTPSQIKVRKQPSPTCYSTLEAIHFTINCLGNSQGFDVNSQLHDNLFKPFRWVVDNQIERIKRQKHWRTTSWKNTL